MSVVLITGMSGVGKSTVIGELGRRGYRTLDTDYGNWIRDESGERLWDESQMTALLDDASDEPFFIQGTVANQGRFYDRFRAVVLLTAPQHIILERIRTRDTSDFGKSAEERDRILQDMQETEPLLRSTATHVIETTLPLSEVADQLVRIAQTS